MDALSMNIQTMHPLVQDLWHRDVALREGVNKKMATYIATVGKLKIIQHRLTPEEHSVYSIGYNRVFSLITQAIEDNPNGQWSQTALDVLEHVAKELRLTKNQVVAVGIAKKIKKIQPLLEPGGAWLQWISSTESEGELPPGMQFYMKLVDQLETALSLPKHGLSDGFRKILDRAEFHLMQFQQARLSTCGNLIKEWLDRHPTDIPPQQMIELAPRLQAYFTLIENLDVVVPATLIPSVLFTRLSRAMNVCQQRAKTGDPTSIIALAILIKLYQQIDSACILGSSSTPSFESSLKQAKKVLHLVVTHPKQSQKLVRRVVAVLPLDEYRLLMGGEGEPIPSTEMEWNINIALMQDALRQTTHPAIKTLITAASINYLAKSAPIKANDIEQTEGLQRSKGSPSKFYHRLWAGAYDGSIKEKIVDSHVACIPGSVVHLTHSPHVSHLFGLMTTTVTPYLASAAGQRKFKSDLKQVLATRLILDKEELRIQPKLLFDLTQMLGAHVNTRRSQSQRTQFQLKLTVSLNLMQSLILEVTREFMEDFTIPPCLHPHLNKLLLDSTAILRAQLGMAGIIYSFPIHSSAPHDDTVINHLISTTGCRLGAVATRILLGKCLSLEGYQRPSPSVLYGIRVNGGTDNPLLYKDPLELVQTQLFQRAQKRFTNPQTPHIFAIGHGTLAIFAGFLSELSKEQVSWKRVNAQPALRMATQTTLVRAMQHLAIAEHQVGNQTKIDYTKFTQAIELMQAEVASLFILTQYQTEDFTDIYKRRLIEYKVIPPGLHSCIETGLAPSGTSVMAELIARLRQLKPDLRIACGMYAYYEFLVRSLGTDELLVKAQHIDDVLQDPKANCIDFYLAAFHPIADESPPSSKGYPTPDVIGDVKKLLARTTTLWHTLTVALDCTIDTLYSPQLIAFFQEFEMDIRLGRLVVLVFRSGQKYDMLGLDNSYGAPFFVVSNKRGWKGLTTLNLVTDPISQLWFSLAHKYATRELDTYRKAIFDNARRILNRIPASLNLHKKKPFVYRIDPRLQSGFVHVACNTFEQRDLEDTLRAKFQLAGKPISNRESFGFHQTNITRMLSDLRICPGPDPKDVDIVVSALEAFGKQSRAATNDRG